MLGEGIRLKHLVVRVEGRKLAVEGGQRARQVEGVEQGVNAVDFLSHIINFVMG